MEMFRHIREAHLTEIKKLNIKIGSKPAEEAKKRGARPGPRSKTKLKFDNFPFSLFGSKEGGFGMGSEVKVEAEDVKKEEEDVGDLVSTTEVSQTASSSSEQEGVLCPNQALTLTLKSTSFRIRLSTEADDSREAATPVEDLPQQSAEHDTFENHSVDEVQYETLHTDNSTEEEAPIEVDPTKDWHVDDDDTADHEMIESSTDEIPLDTSDPYSFDTSFD
jgi:hypothetical protein